MAGKRVKKNITKPTKLTPDIKSKILEVAALDGSVKEMAYYCGVSHQSIYNWFKEDEELFDHVERLRDRPVLLARQTVTKKMTESYQNAMDYLKRKKKDEFGDNATYTVELPQPLLNGQSYGNSNDRNSETPQSK